ncbi:hypothetical protein [Amycolatopsis sp. RTGN1]|uniref:hypothetical protein n=1 Tax=Amycolatopsis ponsaeliensis TaxID=2992142 RepID=UPI00254F0A5E|nr:hypothetical protein [Amycolatopsis sp. RTGN1]
MIDSQPLSSVELMARLQDLLAGRGDDAGDDLPGGELVVFDEGREVFRAALGRHTRLDDDDPDVIWIRPIVTSAGSESNLPAFDLAIVRRRALHVTAAWQDGRRLVLELDTGQRAHVEPARGPQLAVLQDFDTWITTLAGEQRAGIEALGHD